MLVGTLSPLPALDVATYADIDAFRQSERYAGAESIPLRAGPFVVLRAGMTLPSCTLSLVETFPRIIKGYDFGGRAVVVIPMDGVTSARVNGKAIGQALVLFRGRVDCTVYEPEGRRVAILAIRPEAVPARGLSFDNGYMLLDPPDFALAGMQALIRGMIEAAARQPDAVRHDAEPMQAALFGRFDHALQTGRLDRAGPRYKAIVDRVDEAHASRVTDLDCAALAGDIGISIRTMHKAVQAVCGASPHRYGQLTRLWAVRRQLRHASPGLTVKASALAHGFSHMGDFSRLYRDTIGELPSQTLANARRLQG